ncbi:DUF5337 domain-containing protein [Thalassovita mangrovi]|uniref:DUF5337 domain-containing protein n=1 Tax=Thalassovita mangrovi TaxID=2692236 RepID=A0A6L8LEN1_9RHOB|nr:hypothetical protein [Thalassovita mangrovi]
MSDKRDIALARKGRITALVIAGTALFWIAATFVGGQLELSQRVRALFDLIALAGFILAIVMIFQIWRARQNSKG